MPVTLASPGVYVDEVPSGVRTITGVPTSVAAFFGRTRRGPADRPVVVGSFADFERRFGGLWYDGPLSYAIRDFFLNGGSTAIVVRMFRAGPGGDGTADYNVGGLTFEAGAPGAWGNNLKVEIDTEGITADTAGSLGIPQADLFNVKVTDNGTGTTETFRNVTATATARQVDKVVNLQSSLLRMAGPPPDGTTVTAATVEGSTGGSDGAPPDALDGTDYQAAFARLEGADPSVFLFNLVCLPPDARNGDLPAGVLDEAVAMCVRRRAMVIVDPPTAWANSANVNPSTVVTPGPAARNAAAYYPRLLQADPLRNGRPDTFVPCGVIAGIMAHTDATRGVWKAPAGIDAALRGTLGLEVTVDDQLGGSLNQRGVNALRSFPVYGRVVWGARTLRGADAAADEYKYVPVRRLALYIEESLFQGTQWVVFEPNDEPLWAQIRLNVGAFMHDLFRRGAFQGTSPREAYFVKCDKETTTQSDINRGIVNIDVGFAPLKPAEFVVIRLQQMAGQVQA